MVMAEYVVVRSAHSKDSAMMPLASHLSKNTDRP